MYTGRHDGRSTSDFRHRRTSTSTTPQGRVYLEASTGHPLSRSWKHVARETKAKRHHIGVPLQHRRRSRCDSPDNIAHNTSHAHHEIWEYSIRICGSANGREGT
jgi:hypothetical protein